MRLPLRLTVLGVALVASTAFTASLPLIGGFLDVRLLSLLVGLLAGGLASASLSAGGLEGLAVYRRGVVVASEGERAVVEVRVCNESRAPVSRLLMRDTPPVYWGEAPALRVPVLPPGSCITYKYEVVARPGAYRVGPLVLEAGDPLGLYSSSRVAGRTASLVGLVEAPRLRRVIRGAMAVAAAGGARGASRGPGVTFLSLREYTPDDDARMIDWKSLARLGKPLVKEFEREAPRRLLVVLDATPTGLAWLEDREEPVGADNARLAYSVVEAAVATGAQVRLVRIDPDASYDDTGWFSGRSMLTRARLVASMLRVDEAGACNSGLVDRRLAVLRRLVTRGSMLILFTDACLDKSLASLYASVLASLPHPKVVVAAGRVSRLFAERVAPLLERAARVYYGDVELVAEKLARLLAVGS